jgi:hypothetical protein
MNSQAVALVTDPNRLNAAHEQCHPSSIRLREASTRFKCWWICSTGCDRRMTLPGQGPQAVA